MIVTGGAASGKSTICRDWEKDPCVLALDLDVIGRDPAVRRRGDGDYAALWGFQLRLALEIQLNGYTPLPCGFCLPDQILADDEAVQFAGVHMLGFVCKKDTLKERISARPGGHEAASRPDIHYEINQRLRKIRLQPPNSFALLDTSLGPVDQTIASVRQWLEGVPTTSDAGRHG